MPDELLPYLHVSLLLWLRCLPLFLLVPYLAAGLVPGVWAALLSWGLAGSLAPIVLAGCHAGSACAAAVSAEGAFDLARTELVVGLVIALSLGLPCAALRSTGAIAQALGVRSVALDSQASSLGKVAGFVALIALAGAGVFSGVARLLLTVAPPLSAAKTPELSLLRPLSDQVVRAFELGVSLCGPVLIAALLVSLAAALVARVADLRLSSVGPALLPWLGLAIVCLCVANWLDSLPELARSFAREATRWLD